MKKNTPQPPQPAQSQLLPLLGNISIEQFLTEYWQKKPLLIRQAIPNFTPILSSNDKKWVKASYNSCRIPSS